MPYGGAGKTVGVDYESEIRNLDKQKGDLETRGRELLEAGKGDSDEFNDVVDQHRNVHGRRRLIDGMVKGSGDAESGAESLDRIKAEMGKGKPGSGT